MGQWVECTQSKHKVLSVLPRIREKSRWDGVCLQSQHEKDGERFPHVCWLGSSRPKRDPGLKIHSRSWRDSSVVQHASRSSKEPGFVS